MAIEGVKVEGAAQLRRTLKAAGAEMSDMRALHLQVAGIVVQRARSTAPIGPDVGGHIRDTIRPGATQRAAIVRVGTARRPYGPVVHWGWGRRGIRSNPWVSFAAQDTESSWLEVYWRGLVNIINKIEGA